MTRAFLLSRIYYKLENCKHIDKSVLVEIKICKNSINNLNRDVYDKNNAEYQTNCFTIVKIINNLCNEYSFCNIYFFDNNVPGKNSYFITGHIGELITCNKENFVKCYLTKKRALEIYNQNSPMYSYYPDGQIKEKFTWNGNYTFPHYDDITTLFHGKEKIEQGEYHKWNEEGELIKHDIFKEGKNINDSMNNYEKIQEIINNFVLNKDHKEFIKSFQQILSKLSSKYRLLDQLKYYSLLFGFLNLDLSLGTIMNEKYDKLRMSVLEKIKEFQNNNFLFGALNSEDNEKKNMQKNY